MTDQEMKKYEIQQRLMAQQGRMSRAVIGQIMELIDALVAEAGCRECTCKPDEETKQEVRALEKTCGYIKPDCPVMQDHSFFRWPADKDVLFDMEWIEGGGQGYWICRADGYGHLKSKGDAGAYGNGAVFVRGYKNIIKFSEKRRG